LTDTELKFWDAIVKLQAQGRHHGMYCPNCEKWWTPEVLLSVDPPAPHWCGPCQEILLPRLWSG